MAGPNDADPLCIEYLLASQTYRLTLAGWENPVPVVWTLPGGFTPARDQRQTDSLATYLAGDRGRAQLLVGAKGQLDVNYGPDAAKPETRIVGRPDVEGWVLYALRETLLSTTDRSQTEMHSAAITRVDSAVVSPSVLQCASGWAAKLNDASTSQDAIEAGKSGFAACLPEATKALAASYSSSPTRVDAIVEDLKRLLSAGGDHATRVDTAWSALMAPYRADEQVTLSIQPRRYLSKDEVFALPVSPDIDTPNGACPKPPLVGAPIPLGARPGSRCWWVVEADLDGNGRPDRLITWGAGQAKPWGFAQRGATAYLDTGNVSALPLEEASGVMYQDAFITDQVEGLEPAGTAYLSNDQRQQVLLRAVLGAHTEWLVIAIVPADGSLHLVRNPSGQVAVLYRDGAVFSMAGYGCYSRDGTGRIAKWSWSADPAGRLQTGPPGFGVLEVTPLEINDMIIRQVGAQLRYQTTVRPAAVGSPVAGPCTTVPPGIRGGYEIHVSGTTPLP